MAHRNNRQNMGRRMDFGRSDRGKGFGRPAMSPWQAGGPGAPLPAPLPLAGGSAEATLALANNLISNLLQTHQNTVPSLLDMPIRRDFGPDMGRHFDRGFPPNRVGNQGNFRRTTGTYNRAGERINTIRKPFRPNDGPRNKQPTPKKDSADSKAKAIKAESSETQAKEGQDGSVAKEGQAEEAPKTRYDDIDPQWLRCHICNKSMWDGRSFENHLNGRAHSIMMQKTAESYALTADTMRQEFKIREMKRTRKTGQHSSRDFYCAMCNMYAPDGAIHRTTIGHRKLKKYLHPACTSCHKEMPTRIELDEHRLTPEHLRSLQDKQEVVAKPKPEVLVISTLSTEQSYVRDDRQRKRHQSRNDDAEAKDGDADVKKESPEAKDGDEVKEEEADGKMLAEASPDTEDTVLDYKEGDDLSAVKPEMIPTYSTERGVGRSFLSPFSCVQCRLCRKLLDSEETAEVHLRTWRHHQLFVRSLHPIKKEDGDNGKRAATNSAEESEDGTNWKRRKTTPDLKSEDVEMKEVNGDAVDSKEKASADGDGNGESGVKKESEDGFSEGEPWEHAIDEILKDEAGSEEAEPVAEEVAVAEKAKSPEPVEAPRSRGTPRGRGRGRRRV